MTIPRLRPSKFSCYVLLAVALLILVYSAFWIGTVTNWRNEYVNFTFVVILVVVFTLSCVALSYLSTSRRIRLAAALAFGATAGWLIWRVCEPIIVVFTSHR
jgi:hypothetical protein